MIVVFVRPCRRCKDLVRENAELREFRGRAIEHIDDLHAIIADADQREKLLQRQTVEQPKPAPAARPLREGSIQAKIAERQKRELAVRAEAHQYLQNGPTGQQYLVRCPEDLEKAIRALLQTAGRGNALMVSIQEVANG